MNRLQKEAHSEVQENASQINTFLIEEYKHASQYSQNIQRDRTQTFNLYVLMLGALIYAFALMHTGKPDIDTNLFTVGILIIYGFINLLNYARFVTLGLNYRDSISRMDEIRHYYIDQFKSDAITRIYLEDREFNSPGKLRPTNSIVCIVYTFLELLSFVWAAILLNTYAHLPIALLTIILIIAVIIIAVLQFRYYQSPLWR
jgi:hypothetical protein